MVGFISSKDGEGFTGSAQALTYANGTAWQPNWFILPDPPLEPGSTIFVPVQPETQRDVWEVIRDTTAILSSLTTVLILVWQINR